MLKTGKQERHQIEFVCMDELIPEDHLLRKIDSVIDFTKIYEIVSDLYCENNGRPSIDPIVLFKIVLIQHIYGIPSLRKTADEVIELARHNTPLPCDATLSEGLLYKSMRLTYAAFREGEITQDFELTSNFGIKSEGEAVPHYFGKVPLNEIYNDGQRQGDFEQVISLIDAYNTLQSDRVNDKEQFVDSLMYIKGQILGETDDEKAETYSDIQRNRVVELSQDGEIGFLTRQFDEASVEVLRKSIVTDIHKISGVPDMSDDNFAGNASGVAMKYKLLNLEQITKTKERYFTEGLRYRLECLSNIIGIKGGHIDPKLIDITFTRSLPQNELELSQVVATLDGKVPQETLLSLLPFVKDPQSAAEELRKQKQDAITAQQQMFMNTPLVRGEGNEEAE